MSRDAALVHLNEDEASLMRAVAASRGMSIDPDRSEYAWSELESFGFVRENWSVEELRDRGFTGETVVTSFDEDARRAEEELLVDVPFAPGVQKWQLPIGLPGFRVIMTRFPPNTEVQLHEHPNFDGVSACGQLRVVVKGSITYAGKRYGPGEWFFIPNGVPYSFVTDPEVETLENYYYQYNGATMPLRFSSPQSR